MPQMKNGDVLIDQIPLAGGMEHNSIDFSNAVAITGAPGATGYLQGINPYTDKLILNCLSESYIDPITRQKSERIITRSGFGSEGAGTGITTGEARGIFYYDDQVAGSPAGIYFAVSNKWYFYNPASASTSLLATLQSSTGPVYMVDCVIGGLATGVLLFEKKNSTDTRIHRYVPNTGTYTFSDVVGLLLKNIVFMDSYYFAVLESSAADGTGKILNSIANDFTGWSASTFATAENYSDPLVSLARHKSFVVAFGKRSIEFFRNTARPAPDSPLTRDSTYQSHLGLIDERALVNFQDKLFFAGSARSGEIGIYMIDGAKIKKISTSTIDRTLADHYGFSMVNDTPNNKLFMYPLIMRGHKLIAVNIKIPNSSDLPNVTNTFTLVFDIEEQHWYVWTARSLSAPTTKSYNFGESGTTLYCSYVPINYAVSGNVNSFMLHETNGKVYRGTEWPPNDYDWGNSSAKVDYCLRTPWIDFGTSLNKNFIKCWLSDYNTSTLSADQQISMYVFDGKTKVKYKYNGGQFATTSQEEMLTTQLGQARHFCAEWQWSGSHLSTVGGCEVHYKMTIF